MERERQPEPGKPRENVIIESTTEVTSAVINGVTTTIISFIPIFFLTGRDYRLFPPLAWTKTFVMVSAILVALFIVPMLCRVLLRTSRWRIRLNLTGTGLTSMGTLTAVVVGSNYGLAELMPLSKWLAAIIAAVVMGGIVWTLTRERLRPVEDNPTSRLVLFLYTPTLMFFCRSRWPSQAA